MLTDLHAMQNAEMDVRERMFCSFDNLIKTHI